MKRCRPAAAVGLVLGGLLAPALFWAQAMPMATLTGTAKAEDGSPLSAVTVRVTSGALQGQRETATSSAGDFIFALLPPGEYRVTFLGRGLATVERRVTLSAAETVRVGEVLRPAGVREDVRVSAEAQGTVPGNAPGVGMNFKEKLLDALPTDRTLRSAALLAPGVNENGVRGSIGSANTRPAIMISGAQSFENLFLINGVVVNENLRGQPQDLFIEDAIQETTILTGRISAEYGRFTGGVVNAITKSGGNRISGTFRTTFTNDRWTARDPYNRSIGQDPRVSDLNETYEATLGFPLLKDRVWIFGAARSARLSQSSQTLAQSVSGDDPAPIPYVHGTDERRLEGKITTSITPAVSLLASYIDVRLDETNSASGGQPALDIASLVPRSLPNSLLAVNGNAALGANVFVEAQYSRRRFEVDQGGPRDSDLILGTRIWESGQVRSGGGYNAPVGTGDSPERYDNDSWLLKGSTFVSTVGLGSHDLRVGYERFLEAAWASYPFTGSGFRIREPAGAIFHGTRIYPEFNSATVIEYHPIVAPASPTHLVTDSVFVNDSWSWSSHWSFNLGLRYDKNNVRDKSGFTSANSATWSPRLAARFDPRGDGRFEIDAGYAKYAARINNNAANASAIGSAPPDFEWNYGGPCINCIRTLSEDQLVPTADALRRLFDWFFSVGGTASPPTKFASVPGLSTRTAPGGLRSPTATEYSAGAGINFGAHGGARADFLYRRYYDFYSGRIDLSTGKSPPDSYGKVYDLEVLGNSNRLDRRYTAAQAQAWYRVERLSAGLTYTWSRLTGNLVGETRGVSEVEGDIEQYPEYRAERWSYPTGYLSSRGLGGQAPGDQRHRARVWVLWEAPVARGSLSVAFLESLDSGLPYEAVGSINVSSLPNPGYQTPPTFVPYFFTKPGAYRTDTITRTDLAILWTFPLFSTVELFLRPEILNPFNEQGVIAVNTSVITQRAFNPFTTTPVRGVNYDLDPNFGKPTSAASYQQPRTFRFGVGVRF